LFRGTPTSLNQTVSTAGGAMLSFALSWRTRLRRNVSFLRLKSCASSSVIPFKVWTSLAASLAAEATPWVFIKISGPRVSSTDLEYARTLSRWRDGGARVHGCTRVRARPSLTIAATNQFTLDQEERIVRLFSKSLNADPGSGYQASRVLVSSGAVLKQKPPTFPPSTVHQSTEREPQIRGTVG